jgi:hypothetical protein
LIETQTAPTFIRLVAQWTGDLSVSGVFHGRQMPKMLSLQELGRVIVYSIGFRRASKQHEFTDVEFGGGSAVGGC